ncbi:Uncharacterized protein HZ326_28310 [Fusarium oxysporum f. sp. albedinis]|nr:Uncharacterized protein HZ326_28310 [Fusarium oxysporum f. sp. albedinis]
MIPKGGPKLKHNSPILRIRPVAILFTLSPIWQLCLHNVPRVSPCRLAILYESPHHPDPLSHELAAQTIKQINCRTMTAHRLFSRRIRSFSRKSLSS